MGSAQLMGLQRLLKPGLCRTCLLIIKRRIETKNVDSGKKEEFRSKNKIHIECGKYAGLADGCAVAEIGGTAVMATVVGKGQPSDLEIPLSVTYSQKAAAIGRIPTNFLRRDLGRSDYEVLLSRVIDRSIRPLFEPGHAIETQICCNPLALDGSNFPDIAAINAASAALAHSDIPWLGPVAAVRVALIDQEIVVNPNKRELAESLMNLIVSSVKNEMVVMIEGSINNVVLPEISKCLKIAVKQCKQILLEIEQATRNYKKDKRFLRPFTVPEEIKKLIRNNTQEKLMEIFKNSEHNKLSRDKAIQSVYSECERAVKNNFPDADVKVISSGFFLHVKELYRQLVFEEDIRCDGRKRSDIRKISGAVGLYDALHGSSMFKRGQTQVFCTVALDSPNSVLRMDKVSRLISGVKQKNFFFDYEFPPFATGDIGAVHAPKRRETGHGALAENALKETIPDSIPFTIRLTSEVLESNGSSSMASVCGGTMALLDAGIPIHFPVAGVAMGLLTFKDKLPKDYVVLTDIMGMEDYLGDMDFKISGTKTGFTAMQLDVKVPGLPFPVIHSILIQTKKALSQILISMEKIISKPCEKPKSQLPVVKVIEINPHVRGKLFAYGQAQLKKFELEIGVEITVLEDNKISIFACNQEALNEALVKLQEMESSNKLEELEFGGVYEVTVTEVLDHGCYVKLVPNISRAYIPLSQLHSRRVSHPSALDIAIGSQFHVKYFGRDPTTGALRLSRRVLLTECIS